MNELLTALLMHCLDGHCCTVSDDALSLHVGQNGEELPGQAGAAVKQLGVIQFLIFLKFILFLIYLFIFNFNFNFITLVSRANIYKNNM